MKMSKQKSEKVIENGGSYGTVDLLHKAIEFATIAHRR